MSSFMKIFSAHIKIFVLWVALLLTNANCKHSNKKSIQEGSPNIGSSEEVFDILSEDMSLLSYDDLTESLLIELSQSSTTQSYLVMSPERYQDVLEKFPIRRNGQIYYLENVQPDDFPTADRMHLIGIEGKQFNLDSDDKSEKNKLTLSILATAVGVSVLGIAAYKVLKPRSATLQLPDGKSSSHTSTANFQSTRVKDEVGKKVSDDFYDRQTFLKSLDFKTRVEIFKAEGKDDETAKFLARKIGGEDIPKPKPKDVELTKVKNGGKVRDEGGTGEDYTLWGGKGIEYNGEKVKYNKVVFSKTNQFNGVLNDQNKSACLVLSGIAIDQLRGVRSSQISGDFLTRQVISVETKVGSEGGAAVDNLDEFIKPQMLKHTRMDQPPLMPLPFKNIGGYSRENRLKLHDQLGRLIEDNFRDNPSGLVLTYGGYSIGIGRTADDKYFIFDPHGDSSLYSHTQGAKTYAAIYENRQDMLDDLSQRRHFFSALSDDELVGEYLNMSYNFIGINKFY